MAVKKNLLEIVQDILSSLDGDYVNDVLDTVESEKIARIVKNTYYNIIDEFDLPSRRDFFQLEASGDSSLPTHMTIPETVDKVDWVKYKDHADDRFVRMYWCSPEDFMLRADSYVSTDSNILEVTDPSGVTINIRTDDSPTYWTTFDDNTLVFNSYDVSEETTLQSSRTKCYGQVRDTITIENSWIPDLPTNLHGLLFNESLSAAHIASDMENQKAEQWARRSRTKANMLKRKADKKQSGPNFGRNPPGKSSGGFNRW